MRITSRIQNLKIKNKMYIKRKDFETFEKLEDLGKEWETKLAKSKIRGKVFQITEPRIENKETERNTTKVTINTETQPKIFKIEDNEIYLESRGYKKDILSHNIKYLLYRGSTSTLHSKTLLNHDFHKVTSLDFEITNMGNLSTQMNR